MHKRWRIVVGSSWYIMCEFGGWCGAVGCKRAARRANRPKDGFGGRRPTAPAKPGRPEGRMPGACRGWWRRTGKEKLPGIVGEGLAGVRVSGGGGPQAARPQGGQAGEARFGAAEQRRACGPYPGFCRG